MAGHSAIDRRAQPHPFGSNGLVRLGWPHFWLLSGILGGMLALVGLVFFAWLVTRG